MGSEQSLFGAALPEWGWWAITGMFVLLSILGAPVFPVFIVRQQTAAVIERLGRFKAVKLAGPRLRIPLLDRIAGRLDLRVLQLRVRVDTKTRDNVNVTVELGVQYQVDTSSRDSIAKAHYALGNPKAQIESFVTNAMRALVAGVDLDDLFTDQESLSEQVKARLAGEMAQYGFIIKAVPITEIQLPKKVAAAMDAMNAAKREVGVATQEGEAEIVRATAHGKGIAAQREAIAAGLAASIGKISGAGVSPTEASAVLGASMHYEALVAAAQGPATTIVMPADAGPNGPLLQALLVAQATNSQAQAVGE